jgi:hypothetical protein
MIYYQTLLFKARLHRLEGDRPGSCFPEHLTDPLRCPRDWVERAMPWLTEKALYAFLQQWMRTPEEQDLALQWATEQFMDFYRADPHTGLPEELAADADADTVTGESKAIPVERGSFLAGMGP